MAAELAYEEILERYPQSEQAAQARFGLAVCYAEASEFDRAREQLDIVIEHSGGHLMVKTKDGVKHVDPLLAPNFEISKAFVHAVKTGDSSAIKSPYADAVKSTAISLAALKSAETGKPVDLKDL